MSAFTHALTVDVEDAVNQAMRNFFLRDMEPTERVYDNTRRLLDLFAESGVSCTFFILGEVARTFPQLIREIAKRGHELGIHGYSHRRYHFLSEPELREEVYRAKASVEDLTGKEVIGHRAPEFSISGENLWVLDLLLDLGIKYDSSIYPVKTARYGWSDFNPSIDWLETGSGRKIIEAPLSVVKYGGKTLPASGGGTFRAFPYGFTRSAIRRLEKDQSYIFYMHPYEIDIPPFQEFYMDAVRNTSFRNKLKLRMYWFNRQSVYPKLSRLIREFRFAPLREVISSRLGTDFQS
jgi:polysaccharide deacetylase family protein (PEP-CTERM system associated)